MRIMTIIIFGISIIGIVLNRSHTILILVCIELMLLSVNLNFIIFSIYLDDALGQIFVIGYCKS